MNQIKQNRIKDIIRLLKSGYNFKDISKMLKFSLSTIYNDYKYYRIHNDYEVNIILVKLNKFNLKNSLENLCYSDITILSNRFSVGYWKNNKKFRIEKLFSFLSMFYYFDLNPLNYNRDKVKLAYFRKAKLYHPDFTKRNTEKEFNNLNIIYNTLLRSCIV